MCMKLAKKAGDTEMGDLAESRQVAPLFDKEVEVIEQLIENSHLLRIILNTIQTIAVPKEEKTILMVKLDFHMINFQ